MQIIDERRYEELYSEFELDNPDIQFIQDQLDINTEYDNDTGFQMSLFVCPFEEATDCTYTITDFIRNEADMELVKNAAAAHIAVDHVS